MKSVKLKSSVFSILAVMVAMPSLAQSFGADPASPASSSAMPQHIPSVVYKSAENQLAGTTSVDQVSSTGEVKVKFFRPDRLGVTNSSSNMFVKNDHASFTLVAPTQVVNGAMSFVGTVSRTPIDSSVVKWVQIMSLAATRKINAEFAYSAQLNKSSRFDSVIAYRLHPAADSGKSSDVLASVQYSVKF